MYCSNCGRQSGEKERFCTDCGNRFESNRSLETPKQDHLVSGSFEELIAARVREARKKNALVGSDSSGSPYSRGAQNQPKTSSGGETKSDRNSPFLFSIVTFGVGLLAMIVGYLIFPFAYVIDYYEGYARQFNWRLPSIASLLSDRSDEGYVFGPALSFLVGGYLWTLAIAILISTLAFFSTRQIEKTDEDLSDERNYKINFAIVLGRFSVIMMLLLFTWQVAGMWTLQRAADAEGGLSGDNGYSYFSLGFGSVLSLLGIIAFIFAGTSLTNRATVERNV